MPAVMERSVSPFLQQQLERRDALQAEQDGILTSATTRIEQERSANPSATLPDELNEDEERRFNELGAELAEVQARVDELRAAERRGQDADAGAQPVVEVNAEPMTYRRGGGHSYFRDLARAANEGGGDMAARERLLAHRREIEVELGREERANMNRTDGTGGEFVPPLWLIDEYIALARAGRVTADLCRRLPLPGGTDQINLPSVATGTAVAAQTDNNSVQKTDMTTSSVSASVRTFAGQQVFAMQLLDQSPINFDEVVFADLIADLAVKIDAAVINGGGAPSFSGLLGTSSIVAVSYTDTTPTVPELYPKVADAIQQGLTNRYLPYQAIVMHPRRWAWVIASLDSSNRPLVVPNAQGPNNAFAGMEDVRAEGSVGSLQGLPVYTDANIPINLGSGTNEDRILLARFDDLYLYEGDIRSRVLFETDADTLSVRLQIWEYAALLATRYPKSIGVISGTGLVTPTF
jgi:HK97 family phage major capsid protein